MTRSTRYLAISFVYLLIIIALIAQSYALLISLILISVGIGLWIEKVDNQRDEKFKHHNAVHHYHH